MNLLYEIYHAIRYGKWSRGFEQYEGKPQFKFARFYYDGVYLNVLHLGPLWIECDY